MDASVVQRLLKDHPKAPVLALGAVLLAAMGAVSWHSGSQVTLLPFFLIPVAMVAWELGRSAGVFLALAIAAAGMARDTLMSHDGGSVLIYGDALARLGLLGAFSLLVSGFRQAREEARKERDLARTDPLTGAANRRRFEERAEWELRRARRHSRALTVAYLDIDDFKEINDTWGHRGGDALLKMMVDTLRKNLRDVDTLARLGGDEFALLLPDADEEFTRRILERVRDQLAKATTPVFGAVSFSDGAITFHSPPSQLDQVLDKVDSLMYRSKNNKKWAAPARAQTANWRSMPGIPISAASTRAA